jgi:hypothetical protein
VAAVTDDPAAPLRPADAPAGIYGPDGRPRFFAEPAVDRFVATLVNLACEVWVQEERILALETKARGEAAGLDREALLSSFMQRVFAPLREPDQTPTAAG